LSWERKKTPAEIAEEVWALIFLPPCFGNPDEEKEGKCLLTCKIMGRCFLHYAKLKRGSSS